MKIFISAGEPSGDIHGANLAHALKRACPGVKCVGFGGENMQSAGCELLYPLTDLAVMWITRVIANIATFLRLLSEADRYFRQHRPDAVVLIDFPGFNWWIARRARFHGIPVYYFVPPQIWAWASWRVEKMRRFVNHVLCSLPFEVPWYQERGVEAHYVGHPFFDELPQQTLDLEFLAAQRAQGSTVVALLPGSRTQEVERNLSTMVRAAREIHAAQPKTRFLVACYRPHHQQMIDAYLQKEPGLPITTFVGRTPEIIQLATACIAVSGSVSLELLYHRKPTVIVYRVGAFTYWFARKMVTIKYMTLVNLLADKELYPEFPTKTCPAGAVAKDVLNWLNDPAALAATLNELDNLRRKVAHSGACARSAQFIVDTLAKTSAKAA